MKPATLPRLLVVYVLVSLALAGLLTILVVRVNPGTFGFLTLLELGLAMLWIAVATNAVFSLLLALLWLPLWGLCGRPLRDARGAYYLGGLVALNTVWCMWNRLAMANSFASGKRRIMTWTSVIELACLALVLCGTVAAFVGFSGGGRARKAGALGLLVAVGAALAAFTLGARQESFHRRVSHAQIVAAAEAGAADAASRAEAPPVDDAESPVPTTAAGRRVIAIGADGIDWSVLVPLMKDGRLPNIARFVADGACGYLDNGNQSYSPVIWTTMFTGLPGEIHGVFDFQKPVLPRTKKGFPNPLLMPPTIDSFYGLKSLLGNAQLKAPGLWHMAWVGARDRRVPTVWDVASHAGKRVAICDALANLPARPVNGAIINLGRQKGASSSAFHPAELRERWKASRTADPEFEKTEWGRFNGLSTRFDGEVTFALDILAEYGTDFCFYYTYFVDSQCHNDWNFYAPDAYFLDELPRDLDDVEWEAFLLEHAEERAIKAYAVLDEQLGRFRERFPDALFVIISDHGWTFSGYEHFNSPDGVVLFSGPGVKAGLELEGVHIQDIAPTLLALLAAPLSRQLPGRVVTEAFDFELSPVEVDSYRDVDMSFATDAEVELSAEEEQRLRDIGYVR